MGFDGPRVGDLLAGGFLTPQRHVVRVRTGATVLRGFQMLRETAIAGVPGLQPTLAGLCEYLIAQAYGASLPCEDEEADADRLVEKVVRVLTDRGQRKSRHRSISRRVGRQLALTPPRVRPAHRHGAAPVSPRIAFVPRAAAVVRSELQRERSRFQSWLSG